MIADLLVPIYQTNLFINNEFVHGSNNTTIAVIDPSTELEICKIAEAVEEDVEKAVQAAERAYATSWSQVSPTDRVSLIFNLASLIDKNRDYLTKLESWNTGRPFSISELDMTDSARFTRFFAGCADKVFGKTTQDYGKCFTYTRKEPYGVVGVISPWNFPLYMMVWKIIPAIAAGNCVVAKPSEITPLACLFFGQLVKEAGFPPGVINILPGYGHIAGNAISHHPRIGKVAFTGSTAVGRLIQKACSETNLKKCSLELGGKSPILVFGDANLEKVIEDIYQAAFFNSAQNCIAGSRILVQDTIYEKFVEAYKARVSQTKIGNYTVEGAELGPLINKIQYEKVLKFLAVAKEENLNCLIGGKKFGEKGYFIYPTVFTNVKDSSRLATEEIFGPVSVVLTPFKTVEEAIARANDTPYGLCSGVFSENMHTIQKCIRELQAGTVYVNNYTNYTPSVPFNGFKQSGFGTDNGVEAIEAWTRDKTVYYQYEL